MGRSDAIALMRALVTRLGQEGLQGKEATIQHVGALVDLWQLPMYNLEFKKIPVSMEELEAKRDDAYGWLT